MPDKMTCHGLKSYILSWLFIQAFAKHSTDDQLSLSVINFLYTKNGHFKASYQAKTVCSFDRREVKILMAKLFKQNTATFLQNQDIRVMLDKI